ncbi:FliA/WhiG family RNA polymerase sigma factor [Ktedonosporobacter rubrisoli]|uniref:RNA polymerase sigma factor n=1 Tax=Ktedonosporobacter rubrisoli TaxID=2509675 RepID=A0A4P6K079_KTERU|nr:FliA/WhiG family RNA polymerase sigma factor [Ktedonosporobacter rubrisoli]QBD81449.1 FliA/WhiG family RNA polymerase sigma factor [Ktedonosporobacter rubrisoli]
MGASATVGEIWMEFAETRHPDLREKLITAYASLVRFVVGRLGIPPTSLLEAEDLVSYGMIGLINAIDRFDPSRGIRFEAFATPRIRGAVIDQLRSLNWLPRSAVSRVRQIEATLADLEQRLGRPAKEAEVVAELGISVERYRQVLLEVSATILSLDAPLCSLTQDDEVTSLGDLLEDQNMQGPAEEVEQQELEASLSAAIERLPEREQLLLSLYYQEELTMKEISKIMSISESRVCQLHMQAIMRLRGALSAYRSDTAQVTNLKKRSTSRSTGIKGAAKLRAVAGSRRTVRQRVS